ncbi:hypothetical protein ALC53_01012 [Atta colombica]|uniref:Uncharacterized protein n=1 Tax=Atta colombica TaxID=520822 RepID=A0A195BX73_9HYME|nr:hypothetical protein ALC53_01012 [Atta colombica]
MHEDCRSKHSVGELGTVGELSGRDDTDIEEAKRGRRVLTEFAPAADDRAVGEPRIDCEEPR